MSATPVLQDLYEITLLFNLLKKDILPRDKKIFDRLYIQDNIFSEESLKRRLFGLVSYLNIKDRFFLEEKTHINVIK